MHNIVRRYCSVNKILIRAIIIMFFSVALICLSYWRKEGVNSIEGIIIVVAVEESRDELQPQLT